MTELERLIEERTKETSRFVPILFHMLIILLLPALSAVFLGNTLKEMYKTSSIFTFFLLICTLFLSLVYVWRIYKKMDTHMVELDTRIQDLKKESLEKETQSLQ